MGTVNKVFVVGYLGRDAELRYTPGGAAVASLSVATTDVWTDKGGQKQEKTEWHRVVLWGKAAESLTEYLTKGKLICVEGSLQTRKWEKDGVERYTTEIKAGHVTLLSSGSGAGRGSQGSQRADGYGPAADPNGRPGPTQSELDAPADRSFDDDIPF